MLAYSFGPLAVWFIHHFCCRGSFWVFWELSFWTVEGMYFRRHTACLRFVWLDVLKICLSSQSVVFPALSHLLILLMHLSNNANTVMCLIFSVNDCHDDKDGDSHSIIQGSMGGPIHNNGHSSPTRRRSSAELTRSTLSLARQLSSTLVHLRLPLKHQCIACAVAHKKNVH